MASQNQEVSIALAAIVLASCPPSPDHQAVKIRRLFQENRGGLESLVSACTKPGVVVSVDRPELDRTGNLDQAQFLLCRAALKRTEGVKNLNAESDGDLRIGTWSFGIAGSAMYYGLAYKTTPPAAMASTVCERIPGSSSHSVGYVALERPWYMYCAQ